LIIAWLGVGAAYLIDTIAFAFVIVAVFAMRARPEVPVPTMGGFAAAMEGLRYLRGAPILFGVMLTDFVATLFGVSTSLMPIFADRVLHAGPSGFGLLLAAPAAGALVASTIMGFIRLPERPGLGVFVSVIIYGVCLLGFGLSHLVWLSLILLAGSGAADSVSMSLRHALRNLLSPDALRGRIAAVHRTLGVGGPQLGDFEAGALASLIGAGPAVAVGGVGTLISTAWVVKRIPAILNYRMSSASSPEPAPAEAAKA